VSINNVLFIRSGDRDAITIWYDEAEYTQDGKDKFDRVVEESMRNDPSWLDRLLTGYDEGWQKIFPYVAEGREIQSYQELKQYCDDWQSWWTFMSLVFSVAEVAGVSRSDRDRLVQARSDTQEYSEYGGEAIYEYLESRNALLAEAWPFMSVEEVLLAGKEAVSDEWIGDIIERKKGVCLLNDILFFESDLDKELKKRGIRLKVERRSKGKIIKGSAAAPGSARGLVKVVSSYKDIDLVKKGQVLVTEMTMPSFVPAMKRAAAIVTDEGGVTCHAAIVSRELKKPCVIGTKIATQVLKDGDEVGVDANKGIVRKIGD